MMTTALDELTALDVAELTDCRLTLGWASRPPCVSCGTPTSFAALNLGWTGTPCDAGCCTGPTMPRCAACAEDLATDARAELATADKEATK